MVSLNGMATKVLLYSLCCPMTHASVALLINQASLRWRCPLAEVTSHIWPADDVALPVGNAHPCKNTQQDFSKNPDRNLEHLVTQYQDFLQLQDFGIK